MDAYSFDVDLRAKQAKWLSAENNYYTTMTVLTMDTATAVTEPAKKKKEFHSTMSIPSLRG